MNAQNKFTCIMIAIMFIGVIVFLSLMDMGVLELIENIDSSTKSFVDSTLFPNR